MELRKGLLQEEQDRPDISFLQGRIDAMELAELLDIEPSHPHGDWLICHCPDVDGNHSNGDAIPSFGLNVDTLRYNCWVDGGGSLLDLVNWVKGTTDHEALALLTSVAHLEPSEPDDLVQRIREMMHPEEENTVLPVYPADNLFQYQFIHPWLLDRGISEEVIKEMQVGFDPEHGGIIIPHVYMGKLRGWQTRHLIQIGEKEGYYCPRCMLTKKKVPKFTNTPEFPKANTLYNYDNVLGCPEVIVVESPLTALYLKSNGYPNVVAHFGSPISYSQALLLVRFGRILYWSDRDKPKLLDNGKWTVPAGPHSTRKAIRYLSPYTTLEIVPVPDQEKGDANDIPAEMLAEYLESAYPPAIFELKGLATLAELTTT